MVDGLYNKYVIKKTTGEPVDQNADYFVLRIDTDKHALAAVKYYAELVSKDNPTLSEDIKRHLKIYDGLKSLHSKTFDTESNNINIDSEIDPIKFELDLEMSTENMTTESFSKFISKINFIDDIAKRRGLVDGITEIRFYMKEFNPILKELISTSIIANKYNFHYDYENTIESSRYWIEFSGKQDDAMSKIARTSTGKTMVRKKMHGKLDLNFIVKVNVKKLL